MGAAGIAEGPDPVRSVPGNIVASRKGVMAVLPGTSFE